MGCDGGSIPSRADLVKTKRKEPVTADRNTLDQWKYCFLTSEPLKPPVVVCKHGHLYNKEALLRHLIERKKRTDLEDTTPHIKGLKDVKELQLSINPAFSGKDIMVKNGETGDSATSPFICPITGKEMNGNFKFVYMKGCGCVMSEQAIFRVTSEACLNCGRARIADDVVNISMSTFKSDESPLTADGRKQQTKDSDAIDSKQKRAKIVEADDPPYLPPPLESSFYVGSSLSGMSTFRKTKAISSLYNDNKS